MWEEREIAGYLFLGGLSAAASLLAAGADLTARPRLRATGRLSAGVALAPGFVALVKDLGRSRRALNMLRVMKPTSPMSVGTWLLGTYSLPVGIAAVGELAGAVVLPAPLRRPGAIVSRAASPAGLAAAALAPAVATYTAVLLSDTSVPTWRAARRHLPFVFAASAAASGAGVALLGVPVHEAAPARRLAVAAAVVEIATSLHMEGALGVPGEPLRSGRPGRRLRTARLLTSSGALIAWYWGRRPRVAAGVAGAALLAGSALVRSGIFGAGVESTRDPRYALALGRDDAARRAKGVTPRRRE